jgi:regulator of sigma E protease
MFDPFFLVVALVFVTILTVLVAAHELGHYLFARLFGMGVEEFAIGFGRPKLATYFRKTYRVDPSQGTLPPAEEQPAPAEGPDQVRAATETTDFTFRAWPLGGFVRIKGTIPEEDGSEVNIPGGFYSKSPLQRFIVLLMGPVFSILAGIAILVPLFMLHGVEEPHNVAVVPNLSADGPAIGAGLPVGARILEVDGKPVTTFYEVIGMVRDRGTKPVNLLVVGEDGQRKLYTVTPERSKGPHPVIGPKLEVTKEKRVQSLLGMGIPMRLERLSFGDALQKAIGLPGQMVSGLMSVILKPARFKDELGGPLSIVAITAGTTRQGLPDVLYFAGALSISLGIFNLLPIVPLDGGQMVIAFAEILRRGRRLSYRLQHAVAGVGMVLIFALILGVLAADVNRFLPKRSPEKPAVRQEK